MKREEQQEYLEEYAEFKRRGIPFFPDAVFKDVVVGAIVIVTLIALSTLLGAHLEERADPSDTEYTPRPEWYFLFLFQLLKYFPGDLEVVAVIILPTAGVLVLLALPFLDRTPLRHWSDRPAVTIGLAVVSVAVIVLTAMSILESEPPSAAASEGGELTGAALFGQSCAGCHGPGVHDAEDADLEAIVAAGAHPGMAPWTPLNEEEGVALVAYLRQPSGTSVFRTHCAECHEPGELAGRAPDALQPVIMEGPNDPAHADLTIESWTAPLNGTEQRALLSYLAAPAGERIFSTYCSDCHGSTIPFSGDAGDLANSIRTGGQHESVAQFQDRLPSDELIKLAWYLYSPAAVPEGEALYVENCVACHGANVPTAPAETDVAGIFTLMESNLAHRAMPAWGEVLTEDQIQNLVEYIQTSSTGASPARGRRLFAEYCAACHGEFGEGGPHPGNPGDIIAPISTTEYLLTRDDWTLRQIISRGQPEQGMSPLGQAYGGPLNTDEVDAILGFMRSWEDNPPVQLPEGLTATPTPTTAPPAGAPSGGQTVSLASENLYQSFCAQCHGAGGEGGIAPGFDDAYQDAYTDDEIFSTISDGHDATAMIGWGDVLSSSQIEDLVGVIRALGGRTPDDGAPSGDTPTFTADIGPILSLACVSCHGTLGGWDGSSYTATIESGDNGPAVIPGDPDSSLLLQRLLGEGPIMPPSGALPEADIELVRAWIAGGAPE